MATNLALVLLIASILTGEAGVLGPEGEYKVAQSIVAWLDEGYTYEQTLRRFYGRQTPSLSAIAIAHLLVRNEIESDGLKYCMSARDIRQLGLEVDEWYCNNGYCLARFREWKRAK